MYGAMPTVTQQLKPLSFMSSNIDGFFYFSCKIPYEFIYIGYLLSVKIAPPLESPMCANNSFCPTGCIRSI